MSFCPLKLYTFAGTPSGPAALPVHSCLVAFDKSDTDHRELLPNRMLYDFVKCFIRHDGWTIENVVEMLNPCFQDLAFIG